MRFENSTLGDVCKFIDYRGKTPPKVSEGIPLITAKIIKQGTIQEPQEFISPDFYNEWMRRGIPQKGDVIITTEAPLGEVAQIKTDEKLAFAQRIIILEPNRDILNPNYLLYALQDEVLKTRIEARSSGTTVFGIKSSELKKVEIDLPPINIQCKIGNILAQLDDKIANNIAINKNLADMLQAVYQKMFSSEPQNMLAEICSYSRDRVSVNELTIDDYYTTENMLPQKAGATTATNLPTTSQVIKCHVGDVLISNIRPYFKKILYCYRDCGCSNDVLCFTPKYQNMTAFLYTTLYEDHFFDFMVLGAKGTKMPRGDKQQIMTYPIVLPSEKELDSFNSIAFPLLQDIYNNTSENAHLASVRDALLPRLMSGEIDVSAIEI